MKIIGAPAFGFETGVALNAKLRGVLLSEGKDLACGDIFCWIRVTRSSDDERSLVPKALRAWDGAAKVNR